VRWRILPARVCRKTGVDVLFHELEVLVSYEDEDVEIVAINGQDTFQDKLRDDRASGPNRPGRPA
jgi:alcohol dehydrogenase class IV